MAKNIKKKVGTTPMDAALNYLSIKARTAREMELYLDSKQYGEYEVYQVVERLKELGYINDEKYCEDFISSRLNTKAVSKRKLREQLYTHGIDKETIENAIANVPDETELENAKAVAQRFMEQFEELDEKQKTQRIIKRLMSRGYSYSVIRQSIDELNMEYDCGDLDGSDVE